MRITDKPYLDFSGGIRRDKSPYLLRDNEIQSGRNFEIDEQGRIKKRRGSYQFGQNIAGLPINIHHDPNGMFVSNDAASPAVVYKLASGTLTTALTTGSTSVVTSTSTFDTSGTVEIEGDLIAYTGESSTTLTGATGINSAHAVGVSINQWQTVGTMSSSDSNDGAWFAYLNGITFFLFNNDSANSTNLWQYDGSSATAISGEPGGARFLEVFRDRLFTVGNGASGLPLNRVFFSNLGDGTSWPSTVADNSFDLEDQTGEPIVNLKQYKQNLVIFKPSSMYLFTGSLPVRQFSNDYGIHNDKCIQEVNGLLYGVGPNGVFVSNGVSVQRIDAPVLEYYQDFKFGRLSSTSAIQNLFTGKWENKFIIYIGDTTTVETLSDVMLIYDTVTKKWEVWNGWTSMTMLGHSHRFNTDNRTQQRKSLFWGASTKIYRAFEDRHTEIDTGGGLGATRGSDIYSDLFSDTGTPVTFNIVTKPYDLGYPNYRKQLGYLKVFSELPGIHLSYRIDNGDTKPLGLVDKKIKRFKFPSDARGTRCEIILDESSTTQSTIYNGHIFEDCSIIDKNAEQR